MKVMCIKDENKKHFLYTPGPEVVVGHIYTVIEKTDVCGLAAYRLEEITQDGAVYDARLFAPLSDIDESKREVYLHEKADGNPNY
jgi:hypothetical protein